MYQGSLRAEQKARLVEPHGGGPGGQAEEAELLDGGEARRWHRAAQPLPRLLAQQHLPAPPAHSLIAQPLAFAARPPGRCASFLPHDSPCTPCPPYPPLSTVMLVHKGFQHAQLCITQTVLTSVCRQTAINLNPNSRACMGVHEPAMMSHEHCLRAECSNPALLVGRVAEARLAAVGRIAELSGDLEARAAEHAVLGQQVQPAASGQSHFSMDSEHAII